MRRCRGEMLCFRVAWHARVSLALGALWAYPTHVQSIRLARNVLFLDFLLRYDIKLGVGTPERDCCLKIGIRLSFGVLSERPAKQRHREGAREIVEGIA